MKIYKISQNTVTIRTESLGNHHGQSDLLMIASINNINVGTLEFSIFNDEPYVNMIKVKDQYKRQGIGTMLIKELQRKFPETEIHMGMSTEEGSKFLESIPKKFTPNEHYNKLESEKIKLQTKMDEISSFLDASDPKTQRSEMLTKGEEWNNIRDRIYDIEQEIQGQKTGKNIIEV